MLLYVEKDNQRKIWKKLKKEILINLKLMKQKHLIILINYTN